MVNKPATKKLWRQTAIWLVLVLAGAHLIVRPLIEDLQNVALKLQSARNSLAGLESELTNLRGFRATYATGLAIQKQITAHAQKIAILSEQLNTLDNDNIDAVGALTAAIADEKKQVQQLKNELTELNIADLNQISDYFVNQQLPLDLITFLERAAAESAIKLMITPLALKENEQELLRFGLAAEARANALTAFIERIETWPLLLEIDNLTMIKAPEPNPLLTNLNTKMTAVIKTYAQNK